MTKAKDTLTVSEEEPVRMVNIIKDVDTGFPERATVAEPGLPHWLGQGWELDPA